MKFKILLLFIAAAFIISCSSDDNNNNETDTNTIVGTWVATELQIDNATASDDAKNGRDALNLLTAKQCYVITFTFNEDLTVVAENSVNYIEINVNSDGTGLDIPCPTEKDTDNSTYTYDGVSLTILDNTGSAISANATVSGNTLTIDAAGLDIPNFNASGELIFQKQ